MKYWYILLMLMVPLVGHSDVIHKESFEEPPNAGVTYDSPDDFNAGTSDFWMRTNASATAYYSPMPTNFDGTYAYFGEDIEAPPPAPTNGYVTITLAPIDTTGWNNLVGSILVQTAGSDYETADGVFLYAGLDGGDPFTNQIGTVNGIDPNDNFLYLNGISANIHTTNSMFTKFSFPMTGSPTQVVLACTVFSSVATEALAIDAYSLEGDVVFNNPVYRIGTSLYRSGTKAITARDSWTPSDLATVTWIDMSDASTIATNVSGIITSVTDKSGNGNTMNGGTADFTNGTRTLNSLNVLEGHGNQYINTEDATRNWSNFVTVAVYEIDAPSGRSLMGQAGAPTSENYWQLDTDHLFLSTDGTTAYSGGDKSGAHVVTLDSNYDGTTIKVYWDGTEEMSDTMTKFLRSGSVRILANWQGSAATRLNGAMGEFIMSNDRTQATRQRIEGYLAWKWGLVANLPSDHPYKNYPPRN